MVAVKNNKLLFAATFFYYTILVWATQPYLVDDAYITLRCSKHLLEFGQPFFNVNQSVYTITNPLWAYLVAGFSKLGGVPLTQAMLLLGSICLFFAYLLLIGIFHLKLKNKWMAFAGASLFISNPLVLGIGLSGMETPLFLCGILGAFYLHLSKRFTLAWLVAALSLFVRIDAVLIALVLLALQWKSVGKKLLLQNMLLYTMVAVLYLVFGYVVFHEFIPNSSVRKIAFGNYFTLDYPLHAARTFYRILLGISGNISYTLLPTTHFVVFILIAFGLKKSPNFKHPLLIYSLLLSVVMVLASNRDVNFSWYYIPPLLGFYLLAAQGYGFMAIKYPKPAIAGMLLFMLASVFITYKLNAHFRRVYHEKPREQAYRASSQWIDQWIGDDERVLTNEIGAIGYYLNTKVELLDTYGLARIKEDRDLSIPQFIEKYMPVVIICRDGFFGISENAHLFDANYEWIKFDQINIAIRKDRYEQLDWEKLQPVQYFFDKQ